jgi:hypothetical protein
MLSVVVLSVGMLSCHAEYRYAVKYYFNGHYTVCQYSVARYADRHYSNILHAAIILGSSC